MATDLSSLQHQYKQWNDRLYNHYESLFPDSVSSIIRDGVISPDDYKESRLKVMILNREGYTEKDNGYPLDQVLREQIENGKTIFAYQRTMRTHLKQYLAVLDSIGPHGFADLTDDAIRARVNSVDNKEFNSLMKKVAYCNVKKSDGRPKSIKTDLRRHAKKGLDILTEQILYINPSIILAGDICERILEDLEEVKWGPNLYIGPDRRICIWQLKIGEKLFPFVDMYHPSRTRGMHEYYLELLHALQAVEKEYPDFWLKERERYTSLHQ